VLVQVSKALSPMHEVRLMPSSMVGKVDSSHVTLVVTVDAVTVSVPVVVTPKS
jgi:hypothetical protein